MGRRILNFGLAATHARVTNLGRFDDLDSVSNYDAFVFDPEAIRRLGNVPYAALDRRRAEVRDLVLRKGGLVVSLLRPPMAVQLVPGGGVVDGVALLDLAAPPVAAAVRSSLRIGTTTKWGLVEGAAGVTRGYLQALWAKLRLEAFLESELKDLRRFGGDGGGCKFSRVARSC